MSKPVNFEGRAPHPVFSLPTQNNSVTRGALTLMASKLKGNVSVHEFLGTALKDLIDASQDAHARSAAKSINLFKETLEKAALFGMEDFIPQAPKGSILEDKKNILRAYRHCVNGFNKVDIEIRGIARNSTSDGDNLLNSPRILAGIIADIKEIPPNEVFTEDKKASFVENLTIIASLLDQSVSAAIRAKSTTLRG